LFQQDFGHPQQISELDNQRTNSIRLASKDLISDEDLAVRVKEINSAKNDIQNKLQDIENKIELIQQKEEIKNEWEKWLSEMNKEFLTEIQYRGGAFPIEIKRNILLRIIDKIIIDYRNVQHIIQINVKFPLFGKDLTKSKTYIIGGQNSEDDSDAGDGNTNNGDGNPISGNGVPIIYADNFVPYLPTSSLSNVQYPVTPR
jgi:hypothetical protein